MLTVDIIVLALFGVACVIGYIAGLGRILQWVTDGLLGKIFAVGFAYFLFGLVLDFSFVRDWMAQFVSMLAEKGAWYCTVLLAIRIDLIALAALLFLLVRLLQKLFANLVALVAESDNEVMPWLNRIFGVILSFATVFIYLLIILQLGAWITGLDGPLYQYLAGSSLGLDELFLHNPLVSLIETLKMSFEALKSKI